MGGRRTKKREKKQDKKKFVRAVSFGESWEDKQIQHKMSHVKNSNKKRFHRAHFGRRARSEGKSKKCRAGRRSLMRMRVRDTCGPMGHSVLS